jgi:hypothetical protein
MRIRNTILASLIAICAFCSFANAGTTILPNDPNIQYLGRFDKSSPLSPKVSWTGTQIIANFEGIFLKVIMSSDMNLELLFLLRKPMVIQYSGK